MLACIKIENDGSVVAVIPVFELSKSLKDLRNKIEEDELLEEQFAFTALIKHKEHHEEHETTVEDVVLSDDEHAESSYRRVVRIRVETIDKCENDSGKAIAKIEKKPSSPDKSVVQQWKAVFNYQSPLELKRIKLYADDEIKKARGMRSEYLKFWNSRVKELCRQMPHASKDKITAQVNEEWRKEQTTILSIEATTLKEMGIKSPESLKPGTLHKNMQAINRAQSDLEQIEATLAKNLSAAEKQRHIGNQKRARSQLKRAQENMRKNMNAKKQKLN